MRMDIQGLRALAVSLVVIFHLFPKAITGGFIGVDIFFVISGYLITGHLLREVERTGTVKLSEFWARRIRRLLPAAFLVLIASAIAALLFLPDTLIQQNLKEMGLAAFYVLNWGLAASSVDYLASDNEPSMAQHFWSLSVEEQFYIFWPILVVVALWATAKMTRVSKRQILGFVLSIVIVASLVHSIVQTQESQSSAYFITTTRAWEFALGGLAALVPVYSTFSARINGSRYIHTVLSWISILAIIWAAFTFDAKTAFPGSIALIPVLATAVLLWIGDSESTWAPQFFSKAGWVQYLGDISYSVYLWHWPPIVLWAALYDKPLTPKAVIVIVGCTLLAASLTYKYVEQPLRSGPGILKKRVPTYGFMLAGMAAVATVTFLPSTLIQQQNDRDYQAIVQAREDVDGCFGAFAITNGCANPHQVTDLVNPGITAEDHYSRVGVMTDPEYCTKDTVATQLESECILNSVSPSAPKIVLFGDSHAAQYLSALQKVGQQQQWNVESKIRNGCSGFRTAGEDDKKAQTRCLEWGDNAFQELLADDSIDIVLVANRSITYKAENHEELASQRLKALEAQGKKIVFVRTTTGTKANWSKSKFHGPQAPECVEGSKKLDNPCAWTPPEIDDWLMDLAKEMDAPVVDPREVLCDDDGKCSVVIGETIVYSDEDHMAHSFTMTLVPWLAEKLAPTVKASAS